MRAHMPYLTQGEAGRHRAVQAVYVRSDPDDLTGHRLAVARLPRVVLDALHRADDARASQ